MTFPSLSLNPSARQISTAVNYLLTKPDVVYVTDYGLLGDGSSDDHAKLALAVSDARGKRLVFPKGNFVINTDNGTITLEEVELAGEGVLDGATGSIDEGVNLWIKGTTNSAFKVRRGVSVTGLGIYYPDQADAASPTVYPTTFVFDFSNGAVQFVNFVRNVVYNAYNLMDIDNGSFGAVGHVNIMDNYICALNRGIYLRYNAEHVRIERNNFTFGHWLAATEAGSRGYMRGNATAFKVDQSDGVEFTDNLVFGHLNGILASGSGLCQFMNIGINKFDDVRYPIKATGSGRFDGHIFANTFNSYNSQNTALQGRSISIETTGSGIEGITIVSNAFDLATEEHIYTTGNNPTRYIVVGANNYRSWAAFKGSGTYGAINVNGSLTNLQVTGGWFYGGNNSTHSAGIVGSLNVIQTTGLTFNVCASGITASSSTSLATGNQSL